MTNLRLYITLADY